MTIRKMFAAFTLLMLCTCPVFAAEYSVKTTDELTRAIASAQAGDTINLAAGRYIISSTLYIDKAVTLQSTADAVIDANNTCGVIHITGDAVLDGLTITGGNDTSKSNGGGGVFISAGSPTIKNCIITGNKTTAYGGGIYIHGENANTNIINIINCTITNNQADSGGGINGSKSTVNVTNCRISGNSANGLGGGFDSGGYSSLNFTNCTISDNQAGIYGGGGSGGWATKDTLTNCTITGNKAVKEGGAFMSGLSAEVITNCTITGNSASGDIVIYGLLRPKVRNTIIRGGISQAECTNCAFPSGNTQGTNAVSLEWENPIPSTVEINGVTHTVFTVEDNPVLLQLANKGTGENAPSTDQLGKERGEHPTIGAVEILGSYKVTTAEELVNAINDASSGNIITLADGTYTLSSTLTINTAITLQGSGNTVLQGSGSSRVIDIYADAKIYNLTISGGSDNEARNGGGGIRVSSGHPTIKNCTITGNHAQNGGGIAVLNGSSAEIIGCTVTGNDANSMGGGIVLIGSTANITNCTITSNKSYDGGGGVCVSNGSAEITNCNISGNGETNGGGVWVRYNSTAKISNCTIENNKSSGVYVYYRSSAELTNCTITGHKSGSGVYVSGNTTTLTNCTIIGNRSDSGSCLFAYNKGTINIINSLIWNANASKAAYCGPSSALKFTNCALPANFNGGSGTVNNVSAVTLASWSAPVSASVRVGGVAHTVFAPSVNPELLPLKAAGTATNAPEKDQLGNNRDSRPTIGAVESGTVIVPSGVEVSLTGNYSLTMTEGASNSLTLTPEVTAVYADGRREKLLPADYSITWSVQEDMLSLYAMSFSNGTLTVSRGTPAGSYNVTVRADAQADDLTASTSRKLAVTVKSASDSDPNQPGRGSSGEDSESSNVAISVEGSDVVMTISGTEGSSGKTLTDYIAGRASEEIARVTTLNVGGSVEVISGLGAFTSLKNLIVQDCEGLKEVDASDCGTLEILYIPSCDVTALNVDGCTSLNALVCSHNQINSLNLDTCTALQVVDCSNNSLPVLDIDEEALPALEALQCSGQKVSGRQMIFSGSTYNVYLGVLAPERIHSLAAYDAGGNEIQASYDAESGAVVCTQTPASITYSVATGFSDVDMDVTIYPASGDGGNTASPSGSSSGCNSGFGMLALLAAVCFVRKK